MFCLNCGKEIPDNSAVCQFCGVAQPQAQQVPPQAPQEAPQQAPYGAPQQTPFNAPQQAPYGAPQQPPYGAPQQPFPSFAPPTPTKKKNKAPMIIGIVVGAIVLLAIIIGIAGSSGDDSTYDGYAPVETFGEYDIEIETIPEDAVEAKDFHTLEKQEANGVIRFTYYCDGDEIQGWLQEIEIDVSTFTQEEIDKLEADCNSEYQSLYGSIDCVEHSVDIYGDTFVQTYTITNVNDNMDELKSVGLVDGGLVTVYLSYEKTAENWISQGYTEVEE